MFKNALHETNFHILFSQNIVHVCSELRQCSKKQYRNCNSAQTTTCSFVTLHEKQNSEIQSFIHYNGIISFLPLTVSFSLAWPATTPLLDISLTVAAWLHPCGTSLFRLSAWLRPCFRLLFVLIVDESVISRVALGPLGNKGLQATLPGSVGVGLFVNLGGGGGERGGWESNQKGYGAWGVGTTFELI